MAGTPTQAELRQDELIIASAMVNWCYSVDLAPRGAFYDVALRITERDGTAHLTVARGYRMNTAAGKWMITRDGVSVMIKDNQEVYAWRSCTAPDYRAPVKKELVR